MFQLQHTHSLHLCSIRNNGEIVTTVKMLKQQVLLSFWYHSQAEFKFATIGMKGKQGINFSRFQYGLENVLHNSHHSLKTSYKHICQ